MTYYNQPYSEVNMEIKMSVKNSEEMIDAAAKLWGVSNHRNGFEKRLEFPDEIGKGSVHRFELCRLHKFS